MPESRWLNGSGSAKARSAYPIDDRLNAMGDPMLDDHEQAGGDAYADR